MAELLLCSYTAIAAGLGHSKLDSDVWSTSSYWDLRCISRKSVVITVLPLDCRKWITMSFTLQQTPVLCFSKYLDNWLWSCTWEQTRGIGIGQLWHNKAFGISVPSIFCLYIWFKVWREKYREKASNIVSQVDQTCLTLRQILTDILADSHTQWISQNLIIWLTLH